MTETMTFFRAQVARCCDADLRAKHRPTAYVAGAVSVHAVAVTYAVHEASTTVVVRTPMNVQRVEVAR